MILQEDIIGGIGKYILADGYDVIIDLENSTGYWLHDKKHNKRYLDFYSFFASAPIGFNHPKMLEDEDFLRNLKISSINKVSNSDFYTDQYAKFISTFGKIAIKPPMKHAFFVSGGALAVENSLKAAFDWKVRKNFANGSTTELGTQILHFESAFHGRSGYTLSLTNTADPRKIKYFPKFNWPRVSSPGIKFPESSFIDDVIAKEKKSLEEIQSAFEKNKNDIAAIIIEPIQSEGGDIHLRSEFLQSLRKVANEQDAMLIYDEVQTGVGMTGKFWAYEHFKGAEPDMISFGKKTQVCGFLSSTRIDEVEDNVFEESSRINSTWGGNLVDMVRSTKYLEIIEELNLVKNAELQGFEIKKQLIELASKYPVMTNVRGRGLLVAFNLPSTEVRDEVKNKMYKSGVLVLASGTHSIRVRPPLNIDQEAISLFMDHLDEVMKTV